MMPSIADRARARVVAIPFRVRRRGGRECFIVVAGAAASRWSRSGRPSVSQ